MLKQVQAGNRQNLDDFLPLIYDELKKIAAYKLSLERSNHTLQATALVHEAYLRLIGQAFVDWQNRAHFFAVSSQMMRRIRSIHAKAKTPKNAVTVKRSLLDDAVKFAAGRKSTLFVWTMR